jgi:ATP-dependent DNA helicase RecQ
VQLRRHLGFDGFRPQPAAPDGGSLQEQIVTHGLRGGSYLAVLPTGGGKSLCFQLPALVRNFCRGSLTIVISPLQALMRDQIENLRKRTDTPAAALYGLLTPLERSRVLREIAEGAVTILYVAPEQFRNRSFRRAVCQRQIGGWVFDEAHCLSKWGHDFRPDYLYACRAIQEIADQQRTGIPPIAALTATARRDVAAEILAHFRDHLGITLIVFAGGVHRDNLRFAVEAIGGPRRRERVRELCADALGHLSGSVIVYLSTRDATETMADRLRRHGLAAAHFHGGMNAADKKETMARFLDDEVRVICATNAFGMGIDKPDVRLVVHAEMPGTLENYLQEAGRAGRDHKPAACILLFDESDVEQQFRVIKSSELSHRDLVQLLRGLRGYSRRLFRDDRLQFHVTSGELLRDDHIDTSFEAEDRQADTKVRTALSWLERAEFLDRNLNQTSVFTGKPLLQSLAEVEQRLNELAMHGPRRALWVANFSADSRL